MKQTIYLFLISYYLKCVDLLYIIKGKEWKKEGNIEYLSMFIKNDIKFLIEYI